MTVIDAPQRSEAWFAARRGLPTCSRFDRILTAAKGQRSAAQDALIDDLLAESLCPPEDGLLLGGRMTADMEYGVRLEAEARCCYELEHAKAPVTEAGFVLAACGRFGGSPDALVGEDGGVEIKCPNGTTHIGYVRGGTLPNEYKCQVHGYLVVTGRAWWDFFSYHRGLQPMRLRVTRDDFTTKLAVELGEFCTRYNEARATFELPPIGTPPP